MNEQTRTTIENAVVTISSKGGRGVLVSGGLILTAAHCVEYKTEGQMILGDFFLEEIETAQGEILTVEPYAVEPVSDLAVLGALNIDDLLDEIKKYSDYCDRTKPVLIHPRAYPIGETYPVYIFTHEGRWVKGSGYGTGTGIMFFEAVEPIVGGTSGSPVVNELGELVGIVSNTNQSIGACNGSGPYPLHALPRWLYAMIQGE